MIKQLVLLTPEDCIKDRLAAYYHWNDPQSLDQAVLVAASRRVKIREIEKWSRGEGAMEKFERFVHLLNKKMRRKKVSENLKRQTGTSS